jgi:hypothetical protein
LLICASNNTLLGEHYPKLVWSADLFHPKGLFTLKLPLLSTFAAFSYPKQALYLMLSVAVVGQKKKEGLSGSELAKGLMGLLLSLKAFLIYLMTGCCVGCVGCIGCVGCVGCELPYEYLLGRGVTGFGITGFGITGRLYLLLLFGTGGVGTLYCG